MTLNSRLCATPKYNQIEGRQAFNKGPTGLPKVSSQGPPAIDKLDLGRYDLIISIYSIFLLPSGYTVYNEGDKSMKKLIASLFVILLGLSLLATPKSVADDENWDPFSAPSSSTPKKKPTPKVKKEKNTITPSPALVPKPNTPQSQPQASTTKAALPAAVVNPSRETSISRMMIPIFKARVLNKNLEDGWNKKAREIQQNLVNLFNSKSFLEAAPTNRDYSFDANEKTIINETQQDGGDSILLGEFQGQSLELSVKTATTGRTLAQVSVPVLDFSHQSTQNITAPIVDAVVASIRYMGFIVAIHGNEAKINVGKSQGVQPGTKFEIFDFIGGKPTFSSDTHKIGELKVTKVANNSALGETVAIGGPVLPYSKLQLLASEAQKSPVIEKAQTERSAEKNSEKNVEENPDHTAYRESPGLWTSLGLGFFYVDTEVTAGASSSIQERIFEVPLSPCLDVGLGYSHLSIEALVSSLSNSSSNVTFLQGTAWFQLYSVSSKKLEMLTSLGVYYSQYSVTQNQNPTNLLISTSTYSPVFEERIHWLTSPKSKYYGALRGYFPVMANDAVNGSSATAKSFGVGAELAWQHSWAKHAAITLGAQSHYFITQTQSGAGINEFEYSLFTRLSLLF